MAVDDRISWPLPPEHQVLVGWVGSSKADELIRSPHPSGELDRPPELVSWRSIVYTPAVLATPKRLEMEITALCSMLSGHIEEVLHPDRGFTLRKPAHAEFILIDEADRLKVAPLEQVRDIYDRMGIGVVLIGMPGLEKRLSRCPQLYSRVGFVHEFRTTARDGAPSSPLPVYISVTATRLPGARPRCWRRMTQGG